MIYMALHYVYMILDDFCSFFTRFLQCHGPPWLGRSLAGARGGELLNSGRFDLNIVPKRAQKPPKANETSFKPFQKAPGTSLSPKLQHSPQTREKPSWVLETSHQTSKRHLGQLAHSAHGKLGIAILAQVAAVGSTQRGACLLARDSVSAITTGGDRCNLVASC